MPITFKSRHCADILMLEGVAIELIKLMGHSGSVPGSLAADDVAAARRQLEAAVRAAPGEALAADRHDPVDDDDAREREPVITLGHRALPLLDMLETAAREGDYVIWDR